MQHNIVHLHPVAHCYLTFTFFFRLCAACQCLKHFIVFSALVTLTFSQSLHVSARKQQGTGTHEKQRDERA
jgi:hypothetical protein